MTEVSKPSEAQKKIIALRAANDAAVERIGKLGGEINMTSVEGVRDQHLLGWIYEHVLTEAQREDFLLSWLEALSEQLKHVEGTARERGLASRSSKLVTPGSAGFVVPESLRGPGS